MVIERLSADEVEIEAVRALGLDPGTLDLSSPEVLSALIRRAASFSCPTTAGRLVRTVMDSLRGLSGIDPEVGTELESITQDLVGYGDLIELPVDDPATSAKRLLYLAPPSFVQRASNVCLLLGIRPEGVPLVGEELSDRIEHEVHVRLLRLNHVESADELCEANELRALTPEHWLRHPRPVAASELIAEYDQRLSVAASAGDLEGIRIVNPAAPVTYYRARWRVPKRQDSGRFVGRRPQAFGADLWCYLELRDGEVVRLIDLPIQDRLARGCDEAWRLQAALDSLRGAPQKVRVAAGGQGSRLIHLLSPVPSWSQRRLDVVGTRLVRHTGALRSYSLEAEEIGEELAFLNAMMWINSEGTESR